MRLFTRIKVVLLRVNYFSLKVCNPTSSEVLTAYLLQCKEPPWTSYFVKAMYRMPAFYRIPYEKLAKYKISTSPIYFEYHVRVLVGSQSEYSSVKDDQFGMSNFNWEVGSSNYQILRTGCYPYIKYHCSKKEKEDLESSDKFMRFIKIANLGLPCLLYGLAATQLIKHQEVVYTSKGPVNIYFLLPEHKGSLY